MTFVPGDFVDSEPLSRIYAADWDRRLDCRGDTEGVPRLLRALWASGADHRWAQRELVDRLVPWDGVQATFCMREATPVAVPFLVRLAQDPRTGGRDASLDLVLRIAEAAAEGPRGTCFGELPDRWFDASARALAGTTVTGWFEVLDETPEWSRRRDVLLLLALISRAQEGGLAELLWEWAQDATDDRILTERLICLAYASADGPDEDMARAGSLRNWLSGPDPSSTTRTAHAARIALRHLPQWIDTDTVDALAELLHVRVSTPPTIGS